METHPSPHPDAETLEAYALGTLDDAQVEVVAQHIENCPECRRRVADAAPDTFLDRLRAAQARPEPARSDAGNPPGGPQAHPARTDQHPDETAGASAADPGEAVNPTRLVSPGPAGPQPERNVSEEPTLDPVTAGDVPMVSDDTQSGGGDGPADAGLPEGTRIGYFGDYELLRVLGEGGMGIVYKARQLSLNRPVAVKMIRAARFPSADEVRRFQNEAEAVARLDHPNIVPIFEVGRFEDQHYFSMKLIGGESLDKRLKDYVADPRRAARLVATTADAIHHAHQRGILHRDLKPANILVDSDGQPHVTDFGLAKRVEVDSELTRSGAIVGTPAYMAPEQASGKRGGVTTFTDVYGLGAVLYALLAGRAPFGGTTVVDTLAQVRERSPESPRNLNPLAPRDLEIICLKCLEKDPRRRYASADALAEDLRRWHAGEPIAARPVGKAARAWMWCRRNPVVAGAAGLVAASLMLVAVLALLYADRQTRLATSESLRADEQTRHAREQAQAAASLKEALSQSNRRLAILDFERGHSAFENGQVGPGLLWMVKALQNATDAADPAWKHAALINISHWLPLYPRLRTVLSHMGPVKKVVFSPDGRTILTGSTDKTARLWDCTTGQPIGQPMQHPNMLWSVAFSPDGKTVLTACGDSSARLWDAASGSPIGQPMVHEDSVTAVAYSPDGKSVVATGRSGQIWDVATGRPICKPIKVCDVWSVVFSPDGKAVLTGSQNDTALLWEAVSAKPIGKSPQRQYSDDTYAKAFSPDGKLALTGSVSGARIWDAATGKPIGQPLEHQGVESLAFSPDGKSIITGSVTKNTARIWDAATGQPIGQPMVHQGPVRSVAFNPDGRSVLTGSDDMTARFWDAVTAQPLGQPLEHQGEVNAVAYSPDGKTVLTGSEDGAARLWDAVIGQPMGKPLVEQEVNLAAFSPNGKAIVTGSRERTARIWDAATGRPIGQPMVHRAWVRSIVFSPDGKTVLTGTSDVHGPDGKPILSESDGKTVRLWDAATGRPIGQPMVHQGPVRSEVFSPDGKTVLTQSDDVLSADTKPIRGRTARLWDAATGRPIGQPMVHQGPARSEMFSPDGKVVISGSDDKTARLWDAATGRPIGQPMVHQGPVRSVAFSPDGKVVISGSDDKTARLWDATMGWPIGQPMFHQGPVRSVVFSPDGRTALSVSEKTARLWRAVSGQPLGQPLEHQGEVHAVTFSPDGRTVLTRSSDKSVRLWDVASGQPLGQPMMHTDQVRAAAFSPDGKTVLTHTLYEQMVRLWDAGTGRSIGQPIRPSGGVGSVALSPDGKTILTASIYDVVRKWVVPAALPDDVTRLSTSIETATGLELDDQGSIRLLDGAALRNCRDICRQLFSPLPDTTGELLDPILFGKAPTARANGLRNLARWDDAKTAYAEASRAHRAISKFGTIAVSFTSCGRSPRRPSQR